MASPALLLTAFGGPEEGEEALPFVRSVVAGRRVPEARLREVAARYEALGGSPLPGQARALAAALAARWREAHGEPLHVEVGFLHGGPTVAEALGRLAEAGHGEVLVLPMSAYGGAASCRKYRAAAAGAVESVRPAPRLTFVPPFFALPAFLRAHARSLLGRLGELEGNPVAVMTAHSVPERMPGAERYRAQVRAAAAEVARLAGLTEERWRLAWQSRSGNPGEPWFGPSVEEALDRLATEGAREAVLCPVGFVSDHMEVVWDLDREAVPHGRRLGLRMARSETPGTDPAFVANLVRLLRAVQVGAPLPFGRLAEGPWGPTPCGWETGVGRCCGP